ncbi:MAG: glutamine--tRNA ligase, partial [Syntrophomonadaceae bacterium]|nr:glutamine--tRNA ligase [Syntrophomonadaceae bacterium]
NRRAPRVMAVLRPLRVVLENYPPDRVEWLEAENNPENPAQGTRKVPFSRELYIERDDFAENPPAKFFRLAPGREVRLKHAYIIKCERVVKDDATGEVLAVHCTYDPESRSGGATAGRKVKGTLHWVSAGHALPATVRLYDHLFVEAAGGQEEDWLARLNPRSLEELKGCMLEPAAAAAQPGDRFQFLRQGYFFADPVDSQPGAPVFNRIVALRDSWAKVSKAEGAPGGA